MADNDPRMADLTVLIESIVAQVLNRSFGEHMTTWAANYARNSLYLSRETGDRGAEVGMAQSLGQVSGYANSLYRLEQMELKRLKDDLIKNPQNYSKINTLEKKMSNLDKFSNAVGGLAGIFGAYQSGDAIGGAISGYQLGHALGFGHPLIGAGIGLLAGLLSPGVDKWYRPKFKPAKQAFDKLFTMDRGERDEYYMPDSYYFRTGVQAPKKIIVKVGNNQFDDHIRESLTNAYQSQLQRGLVF